MTKSKAGTREATYDRHAGRNSVMRCCHKLQKFCKCGPKAVARCPVCDHIAHSGECEQVKVFFIANVNDMNDNSIAWAMDRDVWEVDPYFTDLSIAQAACDKVIDTDDDGERIGYTVLEQLLIHVDPGVRDRMAQLLRDNNAQGGS